MFLLGRSTDRLRRLLATSSEAALSYREVGATAASSLPLGYRHIHIRQRIAGAQDFERSASGMRRWAAHLGAGLAIVPAGEEVRLGATILVVAPLGPLRMVAPCRIVRVVEEADRSGFAYGTLPGHPECGEEAFLVERDGEGTFFAVTAFSRPASRLVRLAGPIASALQSKVTRRYVTALARHASNRR